MLADFLDSHSRKDEQSCTHAQIPGENVKGRAFHIKDSDISHINNLMDRTIRDESKHATAPHYAQHHIVELAKTIGPIKIDVDLSVELVAGEKTFERLYTMENIISIIELYVIAIKNYVQTPPDVLDFYLMEKTTSRIITNKDGTQKVKDGFHIMCPDLWLNNDCLRAIFKEVNATSVYKLDEAAIHGPWFMYGNGKPAGEPYLATNIIRVDGLSIDTIPFDESKLDTNPVEYFSIRRDAEILLSKVSTLPERSMIKIEREPLSDQERENVSELVNMIGSEHYEDHNKRMYIAWILHTLDADLLDIWLMFCKKRKTKMYDEIKYTNEWKSIKRDDVAAPMEKLMYIASLSAPTEYSTFIQNNIQFNIEQIKILEHWNFAELLSKMYRPVLRYTTNEDWYFYDGLKWNMNKNPIFLVEKISKELSPIFSKLSTKYNMRSAEVEGGDENLLKKGKQYFDYAKKLCNDSYKNSIINQCKTTFFDAEFINKLDSNVDLICVANGIIDLVKKEFREVGSTNPPKPEDYISLCTGTNYIPLECIGEDKMNPLMKFMRQVITDDDEYNYFLKFCSSTLDGHTREEFKILTGDGGNGKSRWVKLHELTLGQYCKKLSVDALTSKQQKNAAAAAPHLMQLIGARFVSIEEPEHRASLNTGFMKYLTGGDSMTGRELFKGMRTFTLQAKYVFVCNTMLDIESVDNGTWRRLQPLEFTSKFVDKPDPNNKKQFMKDIYLDDKLPTWKEAYLSLLVHTYFKTFPGKIELPMSVQMFIERYKNTCDVYKEFIDEHLVVHDTSTLRTSDLYNMFKDWFKETQSGKKIPSKTDAIELITKSLPIKSYDKKSKSLIGYRLRTRQDDVIVEVI